MSCASCFPSACRRMSSHPSLSFVRAKYPRLSFRMMFDEDPMGGILENVDIALHFGEHTPPGPWGLA